MTSDNRPLPPAAPRNCRGCSNLFQPSHPAHGYCPNCEPAVREQREERFNEFCPPLYRKSDVNRLPPAAVEAADAYEYGPRALAFVGPAGLGKTRCMMRLIHRLFVPQGRHGKYVIASEFSREIAAAGHEASKYTHRLRQTEILFIDDLGKGRLTDAVQSHLFDLLEERTAHERPTFWTSNAGGKELAAMFTPDRADPILRRLTEFATIVKL